MKVKKKLVDGFLTCSNVVEEINYLILFWSFTVLYFQIKIQTDMVFFNDYYCLFWVGGALRLIL